MNDKMNMYCDKCNTLKELDDLYDAYYCSKCNEWKESQCMDPKCYFCKSRPIKPKKGKFHEKTTI